MATGTGNGKAPLIEAFNSLEKFMFYYSLKTVRECQNVIGHPRYDHYKDRDTIYDVEVKVCNNTLTIRETNIVPTYDHDVSEDERNFDFSNIIERQISFSTKARLKDNKLNQDNEIEIRFEPTEETKKHLPDFEYKEAIVSICRLMGTSFSCIIVPEKQLWVMF